MAYTYTILDNNRVYYVGHHTLIDQYKQDQCACLLVNDLTHLRHSYLLITIIIIIRDYFDQEMKNENSFFKKKRSIRNINLLYTRMPNWRRLG